MSPELEALVCTSPAVCSAYPAKRKNPAAQPSRHKSFPLGTAKRIKTTAPTRNLHPTKAKGGRTATASLMTTKVDPNRRAARARAA